MQKFTDVKLALREWLTSYSWINFLLPYHLYLLFGGVGVMFLHKFIYTVGPYLQFFSILYNIGYWVFLLGALLTLISPNLKYLPYGLFTLVFVYLFPFTSISFSLLLKIVFFAFLGYLALRYSATDTEDNSISI